MGKHTPEPWHIQPDPWPPSIRAGKEGEEIAQAKSPYTNPEYRTLERANGDRIVACVNALATIPDPAAYIKRMRDVAQEQHAWEEMAERHGLPLKAGGAEAYIKAMREAVKAAEAVKSTIGTHGKITWTHANAVWLLKALDALRTLSTPESEVKRGSSQAPLDNSKKEASDAPST
jgi:hypothetical protein